MADEDPTPVAMICTCRTPGCVACGIACAVEMYPNAAPPVYRAVCGQCGQTVTDIVPA